MNAPSDMVIQTTDDAISAAIAMARCFRASQLQYPLATHRAPTGTSSSPTIPKIRDIIEAIKSDG